MINQQLKNLYYSSFARFSLISFYFNKYFKSGKFHDAFLHIGCGPKYIEGMVNIDGNIFRKKDMWLDVTIGLPFESNSISGIYASHILEHLQISNVKKLLFEFHRILKPDGAVRIVVPSLEYAIKSYTHNETSNLPEWPERYDSTGGRFNNFMLCGNQHFLMFDFSFLQELLNHAGFESIYPEKRDNSRYFSKQYLRFEAGDVLCDSSLYVESKK